ncbi:unnamed protein product [Prunus brigantina]
MSAVKDWVKASHVAAVRMDRVPILIVWNPLGYDQCKLNVDGSRKVSSGDWIGGFYVNSQGSDLGG